MLLIAAVVVVLGLAHALVLGLTGLSAGLAATGLRVQDPAARPIGVPRAVLRTVLLGLAGLPTAGLGLATLALTVANDPSGRGRGWHDEVSGASVVDTRPPPEPEPEEDQVPQQIVNLTAMRLVPAAAVPPPEADRLPRPRAAGRVTATLPTPEVTPAPPGPPPTAPPGVLTHPAEGPPPAHRREVPLDRPDLGAPAADDEPASRLGWPLVDPDPRPPSRRWRVGFDSGESFLVEGLALVGRRPTAREGEQVAHLVPLRSSDMSLSKTHAQFEVTPEGQLVVMDRGSTNGSVLLRHGVARPLAPGRPATLLDGDRIRLGDRLMSVTEEDEP